MRTPWRFVADLVSRKPKADVPDLDHLGSDEKKALTYSPATDGLLQPDDVDDLSATSTPKAHSQNPVFAREAVEVPANLEHNEATSTKPAPIAEPLSENPQAVQGSTTAESSPDIKEPRRTAAKLGSTSGKTAATRPSTTQKEAAPPEAIFVKKTLVDEVAEVETEIAALRSQLKKKLTAQNAQLRKMLARFEAL